jgi:predicted transposase YdaD
VGDWDKSLKSLVAGDPKAFVEWILRKLNVKAQEFEVVALLDTEFQGYNLDSDALLLIRLEDGEEILVHIEFQSTADEEMADRLLEYCFRARKKHGPKPIISLVIWLRNGGNLPEPPLVWALKNGLRMMAFDYLSIKLYEEEAEQLIALNQPALLPLTLLTKGGASRTIVTGIFNELQENGLQRLLPVTNLLAGLVFSENKANLEWLEREYQKMMDILKDSPAYHWMTDDARNEGLEQGREEAREDAMRIANEAILSRFRMAVLAVIE